MVTNNAYVVATGASGTKFLASVVNRHTRHFALHEPRHFHNPDHPMLFFINGRLREKYHRREGSHGVILRDPRDVALSWFNRRKGVLPDTYPAKMGRGLCFISSRVEAGDEVIFFKDMFKGPVALTAWLERLGVPLIRPILDATMATKVNHNGRKWAETYEELPANIREGIERECGWYIRLYF